MAFLEFAHVLWEATQPTIVLTDNKSVTRFFQTKAFPPSLSNACDYVLQFNFKIAHIAGSAINVFSCYLFTYPTSNQDATTIAKVIINIMTKHAYLPTNFISDKGTAFTSHVIKEVADVLGITLKHATTKHA